MASASAASTALPVAGGSRPSMDTDFNPAGNRPEHGHGQMRESSRSSRRKPSGSSSAVQVSLLFDIALRPSVEFSILE